ncbi:SV2-like protein 1 [Operophtera brumata]|uniref:SV2-like protein 1 n=1 Tax=Operophtera brumata TaxID=104452 RepID=A0A0L7L0H0_OPEBR|nr:SV2-like protein 1 [Operophtera brumata]
MALYATIVYSAGAGFLSTVLGSIVGFFGKKTTTVLVFFVSILCGFLLLFIRIPILSIALLFMFLYVAIILGNIYTYLVELNPTHLSGGGARVQLLQRAGDRRPHREPLHAHAGLVVALFLPADKKEEKHADADIERVKRRENSVYSIKL